MAQMSEVQKDEFLVNGEVYEAEFSIEQLKGMKAFEAFCEIYSIKAINGEPIHEEDYGTIEENIIEQCRFHNFKDPEIKREYQAEMAGDAERGN